MVPCYDTALLDRHQADIDRADDADAYLDGVARDAGDKAAAEFARLAAGPDLRPLTEALDEYCNSLVNDHGRIGNENISDLLVTALAKYAAAERNGNTAGFHCSEIGSIFGLVQEFYAERAATAASAVAAAEAGL